MTVSITEFLTARLDEDEAAARAAQDLMDEPWKILPEGPEEENYSGGYRVSNGGTIAGWVEEAKAVHIARHDPQRALAYVKATRALIADITAEKHLVIDEDCWFTCYAATEDRDGGENCDDNAPDYCSCDRDARVERRLKLIASAYPDCPPEWRS